MEQVVYYFYKIAFHPASVLLICTICFVFSKNHRNLFSILLMLTLIKLIDLLANNFLLGANWFWFYSFYIVLDAITIVVLLYRKQIIDLAVDNVKFQRLYAEYVLVLIYAASIMYNIPTFIETFIRKSPDVLAYLYANGMTQSPMFFYDHFVVFKGALSTFENLIIIWLSYQSFVMSKANKRRAAKDGF